MARIGRYAVGSALVGYGALQVLGRRAGSTAPERRTRLPGDELVTRPQMLTNHAITIETPPEDVWPWLTQMGWHLGGWYTPEWVDRLLFPQNWPSLDHLDPALVRDLEVGDVIPDGRPGTAVYVVAEVDTPHTLLLRSTTHLPPGWRDKFGADIDWTWCFRLAALPGERTRLQLRVRGRTAPWWLTGAYVATIIPADYIMTRGMLRGLKRRAESRAPMQSSGRTPLVRKNHGRPGHTGSVERASDTDADRRSRFEALIGSVYVPLQRYLRRRTNAASADDVLGDMLLVLWRRVDDIPADSTLAWCYGVARGCLANAARGAERHRRLLRRLSGVAEPVATAVSEEPDLDNALAGLSPADREVLRLWAWEQLQSREIAVALGITPNAASIRLHRATRRLRERLAAGPDGRHGERQGTEAPR